MEQPKTHDWAWMLIIVNILVMGILLYLLRPSITGQSAPGWRLDSTTYYRNLYQQGKLNYELYDRQQKTEKRLLSLHAKRDTEHRRIDTMSVPTLQRELDRVYGRQSRSAPSQTYPSEPAGGPSNPQRPSRPTATTRNGSATGHPANRVSTDYSGTVKNDSEPESATSNEPKPDRGVLAGFGRNEAEVAYVKARKLGRRTDSSGVRGTQAERSLAYWQVIRQQGYTYPDIAFAISAVETGYYSPSVAIMRNNNLFGMKANTRRNYTSLHRGYCVFPSTAVSLLDYGQYESGVILRLHLTSRRGYLAHLYRSYCTHPDYPRKIRLALTYLRKLTA